ncbi:MAG: hypothetical protein SQA66_13095, partial [Candidatus Fervidibacter sacchari]
VINAQVALAQAETQEIQARYDLLRAVYAMRHAIGEINRYFAQTTNSKVRRKISGGASLLLSRKRQRMAIGE